MGSHRPRGSGHGPRSFRAPLSAGAWAGGIATSVILLGLAIGIPLAAPGNDWAPAALASAACALIPLLTSLFLVRGYTVTRDALLVRRLFWQTQFPLEDLRVAHADPQAMRRAWKLMGNGGFFAWTGYFRNQRLKKFRALATDPARAVVLEFRTFTLVVTPDNPAAFLRELPAPETCGEARR